jgi:uncharacterized Zn finger protein (UPF0148 family)
MNRLENHECLQCGTPLIRLDNIPVCSSCEKLLREKQHAYRNKNAMFKRVNKLGFKIGGERVSFAKAKRVLTKA